MAFWNGKEIMDFPSEPYPYSPGWLRVDCGCCAGLEWGGWEPTDCRRCGGSGQMALHVQSGVLADYPGGPFRGKR